jgi:hypothetical protein
MHWKQIDSTVRIQPNAGSYNDWKEQIAEDCNKRCVYCSIHEEPWGGIDHYHIDHFRPKSKEEFKVLLNSITNLYYACPVCNRFKSDDWPNDCDDLEKACYPDPSFHNYSTLFSLDEKNYNISGLYVASKYIINRLYLNRPQLVYERREFNLKLKAEVLLADARNLLEISDDLGLIKQLSFLIIKITQHLLIRDQIRPYKLAEIRKP